MKKSYNEWDKKIIELALQGVSDIKIASKLNTSLNTIHTLLSSLGQQNHPNYDLDTYQKIQMERNLKQHNIVDKDLLDDIVNLIFAGFTYVEIAIIQGNMTEEEVYNYLNYLQQGVFRNIELYNKVREKYAQTIETKREEIYGRLQRLEEQGVNLKTVSSSRFIRQYLYNKKIYEMVREYIDSGFNLSDQYLATKYGFNSYHISDILTGKDYEELLYRMFAKEKIEEMKAYRKSKSRLASKQTYSNFFGNSEPLVISEEEKVKLNKIQSQMSLWYPMIFTFRLSIEDLGVLTNFNNIPALKKMIYNYARALENYSVDALNYVFNSLSLLTEEEHQKRRKQADDFLANLTFAQLTDEQEAKKMIDWLTNAETIKIIKSGKDFEELTKEEQRKVVEYRLKYIVPYRAFPYRHETFINNVPPEYLEEMNQISDFYHNVYHSSKFGPRR